MAFDLTNWMVGGITAFVIVFARVGSALIVLPGFGDNFIPTTIRLAIALGLCALVAPALADDLPAPPQTAAMLFQILAIEVTIGLFLGFLARLLLSALEVAGGMIGLTMGLANANIFNPMLGAQTVVITTLLTLSALVLIFATDSHHLLLAGVIDSYRTFPAGIMPMTGDMANAMARFVADSFILGLQLAAPFIIVGLVFFLAVGLVARLLPQIQVFFLSLPMQIGIGFAAMIVVVPALLLFWLDQFRERMLIVFGGG